MQGICARTDIIVCIVIGVYATLSVDDIMPSVLLAGIMVEGVVCAVVDCEVEGVNIGAS